MDRPEVIKKQIDDLRKKLQESIDHYEWELVCTDAWSDDMIGFFNLGNARKILQLLYDGRKLKFEHGVYGKVEVWLNPQKNSIFVSENNRLTHDNIMNFMIWHSGSWYVKNEIIYGN